MYRTYYVIRNSKNILSKDTEFHEKNADSNCALAEKLIASQLRG